MTSPDTPGKASQAWALTAGICFGSAAALLTATVVVFVWRGLPMAFTMGIAVVAAILLGLAFFARSRAER